MLVVDRRQPGPVGHLVGVEGHRGPGEHDDHVGLDLVGGVGELQARGPVGEGVVEVGAQAPELVVAAAVAVTDQLEAGRGVEQLEGQELRGELAAARAGGPDDGDVHGSALPGPGAFVGEGGGEEAVDRRRALPAPQTDEVGVVDLGPGSARRSTIGAKACLLGLQQRRERQAGPAAQLELHQQGGADVTQVLDRLVEPRPVRRRPLAVTARMVRSRPCPGSLPLRATSPASTRPSRAR